MSSPSIVTVARPKSTENNQMPEATDLNRDVDNARVSRQRRRPPPFPPTFKRRIDYEQNGGGDGKENVSLKRLNRQLATSVTNLSANAVRNIKDGANKTLQSVKTTFDSFSQKLRRSTRRRHQLENWTTPSRRSPRNTKLYSPFGIDTPGKLTGTPGRYTPKRRACSFVSPSGNFRRDVEAARNGSRRLDALARDIEARRSFRN